jgi:hypothetical protein
MSSYFNLGIVQGFYTMVNTIVQLDFNCCSLGRRIKPQTTQYFDLDK